MAEAFKYDRAVVVSFGGQDISIAPLRGLARVRAFESALIEEINNLDARVREHARSQTRVSAEALLETGVDEARLLKLGLPEVITDELLEESSARERQGALRDICFANGLARLAPFLALEALIEVASKMNQELPGWPMPALNGSFSEPVLTGEPSSAS